MRVLIADDEPISRRLLRAALEPEGYALVEVSDGVAALQRMLAERVRELEAALGQVKQLRGLLPICAYCKKIRDDRNYWQQVESYVAAHTEARFSHGICPQRYEKVVKRDLADALVKRPES